MRGWSASLILFFSTVAMGQLKIPTFNTALYRNQSGQLLSDLSVGGDAQLKSIAEIIQRTNPDILLINELDYAPNNAAVDLFQSNYFSISQDGASPISFLYRRAFASNTGIPSGFD